MSRAVESGWGRAVESLVWDQRAVGMVAAAAWRQRLEVASAGSSTLVGSTPMAPNSLFRIASVTKVLTAAVAMMLVDDGRIDLDEPVDPWLPELAGTRAIADYDGPISETRPCGPVTLRHLLSMTNGMGNYFGQGEGSELGRTLAERDVNQWNSSITADQLIDKIADLPLMFAPGERWLYHLGLDLAGIVIERAAGQRLGLVMAERLFKPLGMADTGFHLTEAQAGRLVEMTVKPEGEFKPYPDWEQDRTQPPKMDRGGGGLISSAPDLAIFGRFLLDGGVFAGRRLLSQEAIDEMTRPQVSASAKSASPFFPGFWERHEYGLGVCISTAPDAISDTPGRFGWWGGTGTSLFMDPAHDVAIVTLTQREICAAEDLGNADSVIGAVLASASRNG